MVKDHSDRERGNRLLPQDGLVFPIKSKLSFTCIIPQTRYHIPRPLLNQSWNTGWNWLSGTTRDRSESLSHHERTRYHGATSRFLHMGSYEKRRYIGFDNSFSSHSEVLDTVTSTQVARGGRSTRNDRCLRLIVSTCAETLTTTTPSSF